MTTAVLFGALVLLSLLFYILWERLDGHKESKSAKIVQDLSGMDDLVAASLAPQIDPYVCIGSGACVKGCPEKNVIGLVQGRAKLINPLGCIGHGVCEAACPIDAITLVYGTRKRGVELPRVDPHFQTNRPGIYIAGELGGMGLIANAINQGRQAADHIVSGSPDEDKPPRRGVGGALDAVVIGAGPAGISATLRLMEAGLNVVLLDRESFGGTVLHYPRAKVVMTGDLNLPLYGRVKRKTMSKEQLVDVWEDIRSKTSPPLRSGELVEQILPHDENTWRVVSTGGEYRAANVVLALGVRGSPRKLGVPGEDNKKVAYRLLEPDPYAGKNVLVVGGGNSAVESAIALADFGQCASVGISYRRGQFARCRAENRTRIDAMIASGQVTAHMTTTISELTDSRVTLLTENGPKQIPNDAIIVQIGGTPPSQLLKSFGVDMVTKYGER